MGKLDAFGVKDEGERFNKSGPTWFWGMLGAQLTKWWEDDNEGKMEGGREDRVGV